MNHYSVQDESGYGSVITAETPLAAAAEYVGTADFSNSTTGYVDVVVRWTTDGVNDEADFRVAIPNWTGCAAE